MQKRSRWYQIPMSLIVIVAVVVVGGAAAIVFIDDVYVAFNMSTSNNSINNSRISSSTSSPSVQTIQSKINILLYVTTVYSRQHIQYLECCWPTLVKSSRLIHNSHVMFVSTNATTLQNEKYVIDLVENRLFNSTSSRRGSSKYVTLKWASTQDMKQLDEDDQYLLLKQREKEQETDDEVEDDDDSSILPFDCLLEYNHEKTAYHYFKPIIDSGRYKLLPKVQPSHGGCRIRGRYSPVIHDHASCNYDDNTFNDNNNNINGHVDRKSCKAFNRWRVQ